MHGADRAQVRAANRPSEGDSQDTAGASARTVRPVGMPDLVLRLGGPPQQAPDGGGTIVAWPTCR